MSLEMPSKWKERHLKAYSVFMLLALGVGVGMMTLTTVKGINWMRNLTANLARATSTTVIVLLTMAVS